VAGSEQSAAKITIGEGRVRWLDQMPWRCDGSGSLGIPGARRCIERLARKARVTEGRPSSSEHAEEAVDLVVVQGQIDLRIVLCRPDVGLLRGRRQVDH